MKSLILCGGKGTRLGLKNKPKCMALVKGKPVLQHIVDHLNRHQVTKIFVNLHMFPEKVYKHFGSQLFFMYEPQPLGWGNTIEIVTSIDKRDDWVVCNGDTLSNVDIYRMYREHLESNNYITKHYNEEGKFLGTMIISPYRVNGETKPYYQLDSISLDIGTPEKLRKANQ